MGAARKAVGDSAHSTPLQNAKATGGKRSVSSSFLHVLNIVDSRWVADKERFGMNSPYIQVQRFAVSMTLVVGSVAVVELSSSCREKRTL